MNNKYRIEKFFPWAKEALRESEILTDEGIPKEYDGYFAAFGATVINMGILHAILFYRKDVQDAYSDQKEDGDSEGDSSKGEKGDAPKKAYLAKVVAALEKLLELTGEEMQVPKSTSTSVNVGKKPVSTGGRKSCQATNKEPGGKLAEWVKDEDPYILFERTRKIVDASVALKLVVRTYPFISKDKNIMKNNQVQ